MADLSALTNDDLQARTRDCLIEIERRFVALDDQTSFLLVKSAHVVLEHVEKRAYRQRQVTALSIGGDKGD